jgi:hypothetical protein
MLGLLWYVDSRIVDTGEPSSLLLHTAQCTASCAGASLHSTSPSLPRCHARGRYVALGVPLLCFSTTSPHMQRHSALVVSFRLKSVGGTIVIRFSLEDRVQRFGIGFAWPESCAA